MDKKFFRDKSGQRIAPLPFREPRHNLLDNRQQALRWAMIVHANLRKNPVKCDHAVTFMKHILDAQHAHLSPPLRNMKSSGFYQSYTCNLS